MTEPSPINPIPPLVLAIFAAMALIEVALSLGGTGMFGPNATAWRITAIEDYAFAPRALELIWRGYWDPALLIRLVSYPFVHATFTHALFGSVLWLALGKFASDAYRPWAVAVIFLSGVICGALAYGAYGIWAQVSVPLVGAYPGDFAMIGAFTYISWLRLGQQGGNRFSAFAMIGTLMMLQLTFSVIFGTDPTWVAELTAFIVGGTVSILVAPGGWSNFLDRLRQR